MDKSGRRVAATRCSCTEEIVHRSFTLCVINGLCSWWARACWCAHLTVQLVVHVTIKATLVVRIVCESSIHWHASSLNNCSGHGSTEAEEYTDDEDSKPNETKAETVANNVAAVLDLHSEAASNCNQEGKDAANPE